VAGCRSDADCDDGAFCTGPRTFSCEAPRCEALPPAIACGPARCESVVADHPIGRTTLVPCCLDPEHGECGLDMGFIEGATPACQPAGQPVTSDPACPTASDGFGASYAGCRLDDGSCGVDVDSVMRGAGAGCQTVAP
jgi:hypothetical protein